jgi:hypothetical protein
MNFDKETLIEIEDYIQALDESVGLKVETIQDIAQAINKQRGLVKKLTIPVVVKSFICDAEEKGGSRCETQCLGCDGFQRMDEACYPLLKLRLWKR